MYGNYRVSSEMNEIEYLGQELDVKSATLTRGLCDRRTGSRPRSRNGNLRSVSQDRWLGSRGPLGWRGDFLGE